MKAKRAVSSLMYVCVSLAMLTIAGCDGGDDAVPVVQASLPIGFFLTTSPGEPVAVQQLKTEAQPGDEAIVPARRHGVIATLFHVTPVMRSPVPWVQTNTMPARAPVPSVPSWVTCWPRSRRTT